MKTLSERLAKLREGSGLSARALGALAGLSDNHVTKLENGARHRPEATTLAALARVLGTTVEWLLTGDGSEPTAEQVRVAVKTAQEAA